MSLDVFSFDLTQWITQGLADLEVLLAKHAAFTAYLEERT